MSWKYNLEKHCVDEQPTIKEPKWWDSSDDVIAYTVRKEVYSKNLASLRSILVSGKCDWKNGEDVTGKFTVRTTGHGTINGIPVADPIIKQEQPQVSPEDKPFLDAFKAALQQPIKENQTNIWYDIIKKFGITCDDNDLKFLLTGFTIKRKT